LAGCLDFHSVPARTNGQSTRRGALLCWGARGRGRGVPGSDEVNTATNQEVAGSQQNLGAGSIVGTLGGPGYATLVANLPVSDSGVDAGTKGAFFSLEPGNVTFENPAFALVPSPMFPGSYIVIQAFDTGAAFPVDVVQVSATEGTAPAVTKTSSCVPPAPSGTTSVGPAGAVGGNRHFYITGYAYGNFGSMPVGIWICDDP